MSEQRRIVSEAKSVDDLKQLCAAYNVPAEGTVRSLQARLHKILDGFSVPKESSGDPASALAPADVHSDADSGASVAPGDSKRSVAPATSTAPQPSAISQPSGDQLNSIVSAVV